MKLKPFEYVLAHNPMVPATHPNNIDYIVRLIEPIGIFGAIPENCELKGKHYITYQHGDEFFTIFIHHLFMTDFIDEVNPEESERKQLEFAHQQIKKAWNWYRAYLDFEDEAFDEIENLGIN